MTNPAIKYGAVVTVAIFFAGWLTGMGGSPLPNLMFSVLMGIFAAGLYALAKKMTGGDSRD